jgi:glycosyltransferase involved in cell wall biosynthesis
MKILLLTDTIAPYRIPVFNLLAGEKNLDFSVLSLTKNMAGKNWEFDERLIKFKYRILKGFQFPFLLKIPLVISFGLRAALKKLSPDLIIITGYYQPAFPWALLYCKRRGIRVVCLVESSLRTVRLKDIFSRNYRKWFIERCDAFIAPGERSREFLLNLKISRDRIFIAPNAADNSYYQVDIEKKYAEKRGLPGSRGYPERNFLYVGRIVKEKGIEALLKAYKEADLGERVGLLLVGAGRHEAYFKRLAGKLKLRNVFFEGFKQARELKGYYRLSDVFVFPSLSDPWGMVLNEAASSGLPIITSGEPAASETLVSDKNGWKFEKGDVAGLRDCLKNILLPEGELIKRGVESQKKAFEHSPEKCVSSIVRAINHTLSKKKIAVSSAGVLYSHSIARVLYGLGLLYKLFTPRTPRGANYVPARHVKRVAYPYLLFRPMSKLARKYKNFRNIFTNRENILFDKCVGKKLRGKGFDIFHGFSGCSFHSMVEAKKQGKACIIDQHDVYYKAMNRIIADELDLDPSGLSNISYWPPHKGYHRRVDAELELADYIFVPSTFSFRSHAENNIPREKLILMPFGIRGDSIAKDVKPGKKDEFRIGFVGSIGLRKGIGYLLEAVKGIADPAIKAYLAGSFSARCDIVKRYPGCYKLMGYIRGDKMREFISELDVLALPSISDSFGIVILEAMAQGVPVIATENTGGPDIIADGESGFIVPIRDAAAIKERILFLYKNRDAKITMGKKALERVSDFTWEKYAERYENFAGDRFRF